MTEQREQRREFTLRLCRVVTSLEVFKCQRPSPHSITKKYIFVILACLSISFSSLIVEAAAATGEYSYDGMGRVVLEKNMVNNVNTLTQDMFYKGDPGSRVPNINTNNKPSP